MNDDFFALVDTDALKALSGQPSASGAAMLLVDTHGLIRAQTAAAGELLELELVAFLVLDGDVAAAEILVHSRPSVCLSDPIVTHTFQ